MKATSEQMIASIALKKIDGASRVALGPGLPEALRPHLPRGLDLVQLPSVKAVEVDLVLVEAVEVSDKGDLATGLEIDLGNVKAARWIVTAPLGDDEEKPLAVRECRFPITRPRCVDLLVTELGVIRIGRVGFELEALAPGVSSDDVRMRVRASLHVADGIRTLRL